jgi:hypothetical protein
LGEAEAEEGSMTVFVYVNPARKITVPLDEAKKQFSNQKLLYGCRAAHKLDLIY